MHMTWCGYLLLFASGLLLTNGIPHFVQGLSGASFQSPFAKPPGVGESSPLVNVYWGFANLAAGIALFVRFAPEDYFGWAALGVGSLAMGTQLSLHFGRVRAKAALH